MSTGGNNPRGSMAKSIKPFVPRLSKDFLAVQDFRLKLSNRSKAAFWMNRRILTIAAITGIAAAAMLALGGCAAPTG